MKQKRAEFLWLPQVLLIACCLYPSTVHYNGYIEYSDEPFDSTRLRNRAEVFRLGKCSNLCVCVCVCVCDITHLFVATLYFQHPCTSGSCLPGMTIAVSSMRKGERARFLITSEYYFKDMGCPPRVPPGATGVFSC